MRKQQGFTLIELIAVIVILGILAATAIPRFVDLSAEAQTATTQAIGGNISSASAMNYALYVANTANATTQTPVTVDDCTTAVVNGLMQQDIPTNYTVAEVTAAPTPAAGEEMVCSLTPTNGTAQNFTMIYVP